MPLLTDAQVNDALAGLPGWSSRSNRLEKELSFRSFGDAIAFLVRVAFEAEAADHHPDVAVHYRRVTFSYWTHTEGGLTERDIAGATMIERLLAEAGAAT